MGTRSPDQPAFRAANKFLGGNPALPTSWISIGFVPKDKVSCSLRRSLKFAAQERVVLNLSLGWFRDIHYRGL